MKTRGLIPAILTAAVLALAAGVLPAAGIPQAAEEPEITAKVDRTWIFEGEAVLYEVTLSHMENPPEPNLSAFIDFDVQFRGAQSIDSVSFYIVNGRRTEIRRLGKVFRYLLTPKRSGVLSVPAPTAEIDGREYRGPTLQIEVTTPEEQDVAILSVEADRERTYLLQPFTVTLTILVKPLPDPHGGRSPLGFQDAPALFIPWVDQPEGLEAESASEWLSRLVNSSRGFTINAITTGRSSFESFFGRPSLARFDLEHRRVAGTDDSGESVDYFEYTLSRRFTPQKVGEYAFGPVTLKGAFADGMNGQGGFDGRQIYSVSKIAKVTVTDAPLEGRPDTYTGAVGRFTFTADIVPRSARVGDPMTLALTLKGQGTLERPYPPEIEEIPAVAENFKVYDATEETKGRSRTFTFGIRPLNAGTLEFPPVAFSYFDVERERYVTLSTDPVRVQVEAADRLEEGDIVAGAIERGQRGSIELEREGIFADVMDLSGLRNESVRPERWAGLMAGMALFYGLFSVSARTLRRRYGDPAALRRRSAAGRARSRLREAQSLLRQGNRADGVDRLRSALTGFVGDVAGGTAEGMTHKDLRDGLVGIGLESERARALAQILEECDAARYGVAGEDAGRIGSDAAVVFDAAVKELRRSGRLR